MARPRTILISPSDILQGILDATAVELDELQRAANRHLATWEAERDHSAYQSLHLIKRRIEDIQDQGVDYSIPDFLGRHPTASERIITQRLIRKLATDGLVTLIGQRATRVLVTDKGLQELEKQRSAKQ